MLSKSKTKTLQTLCNGACLAVNSHLCWSIWYIQNDQSTMASLLWSSMALFTHNTHRTVLRTCTLRPLGLLRNVLTTFGAGGREAVAQTHCASRATAFSGRHDLPRDDFEESWRWIIMTNKFNSTITISCLISQAFHLQNLNIFKWYTVGDMGIGTRSRRHRVKSK